MKIQYQKWALWSLAAICIWVFLQGLAVAQNATIEKVPSEGAGAVSSPPPVPQSPFAGAKAGERRKIDITLDNMDIYPVLDQILGHILGLSYVVEPVIKGTISLHVQGSYTKREFLNLFNSILQIHGLAITRGAQGLYKVVRKPNSAKTGSDVVSSGTWAPHPGDVIRVFQLRYLSAVQLVPSLRNFISPGAVIVAEPSINAVVLVDTVGNIAKVSKLLALMDTDFFKDIHWRLFTLENSDAEDLSRDLDKIFKTKGLYERSGVDQGGLQILPLKTINALLVVTKWENLLDVVGHWVTELDQGQSEKSSQVYVYFVQNGQAKDVADLLKQLYGGKKSSSSSKKTVLVKREKTAKKGTTISGELSGEVKIIADEVNNAVIIKARPKDYAIMLSVLKQIDIVPRQVLIDVLVVEVTLDKGFQYGIEWFLRGHRRSYSADIALTDISLGNLAKDTALGKGLPGFTYGLYNSAGDLRNLINLLASKTKVNILSAPNILAVDNKESKIEVTQDVPTATSSTTSTTESTLTQSIQYRSAGVILNVTPSINESGLVSMKVTQEVSSLGNSVAVGGGGEYPSFQTRKATTNLVVQNGHTIVIGGLMKNTKNKTHSGIPFLKDLPVLGYLFGWRGYTNTKKELLITITPYVIQSTEQADALTREFKGRVKSLKQMLKEHKSSISDKDLEQKDDN